MVEYEALYEAFFDKIEKDKDFFSYNNVSIKEAMSIAKMRSERYLYEALSSISLKCTPDKCGKDFMDFNDKDKALNYDLTYIELDMIASIMYEKYLFREFSKLKTQANRFTTKDFNVFSPANERNSFISMYELIKRENQILIDNYKSIDHLTGNMLTIDYSNVEED